MTARLDARCCVPMPTALAAAVENVLADQAGLLRMRQAARAAYEKSHTPASNYDRLIDIYHHLLGQKREGRQFHHVAACEG